MTAEFIVPIVVACIAAAAPLLTVLHSFRKANDEQHQSTSDSLSRIEGAVHRLNDKIDAVETKIDRHLGEHEGARKMRQVL